MPAQTGRRWSSPTPAIIKVAAITQRHHRVRYAGAFGDEQGHHRDDTGGNFREDLYYRLFQFPIQLPPLRERDQDILLLAEYFRKAYLEKHPDLGPRLFSAATRRVMVQHNWPGNVRELNNAVERALLISDTPEIMPADLMLADLRVPTARPVAAGQASEDVHIRLMVSRGVKATPYQDPAVTIGGPTVVIIPEYKTPDPELNKRGIRLYTVYVRRGYADVQDPRINSHSKLNCIFACIQGAKAGYDEALMLDPHGHVATCNSTHFFIVREGEVWTSSGDYCLDGITRRNVIDLCKRNDIPVYEKNFSLMQAYGAEEAFVTGTFAGLTPVVDIDGRTIGEGKRGSMTDRLEELYLQMIEDECQA